MEGGVPLGKKKRRFEPRLWERSSGRGSGRPAVLDLVGGGFRGSGARDDPRCRLVIKRLPQIMKARLPNLVKGLWEALGDDLVRVQGPDAASLRTIVVAHASVVTRILGSQTR